MQDNTEQVELVCRELNREKYRHRKIKSTYIIPQGCNPPSGMSQIPRVANVYIIQAPSEFSIHNG